MNYLVYDDAVRSLKNGKTIESWLFYGEKENVLTIRYATLVGHENGIKITVWECEDIGNDDFIDIYSFPDAEPDYKPEIYNFEYIEDAFEKITKLGGDINKFTSQFDLQWYYKNVRRSA